MSNLSDFHTWNRSISSSCRHAILLTTKTVQEAKLHDYSGSVTLVRDEYMDVACGHGLGEWCWGAEG